MICAMQRPRERGRSGPPDRRGNRGREGESARELQGALDAWLPRLGRLALGRVTGKEIRLSEPETHSLGGAVRELSRGFTGERGLAGSPYLRSPAALAAYLLFYWPVSHAQTLAVLRRFLPAGFLSGAAVLDAGSGPGPASAAVLDCGARRVLAADPSRAALDAARSLAQAGGFELETAAWNAEAGGRPPGGPYDLIILSHVLNELWPQAGDRAKRRAGLAVELARCLSDRGRMVVIEPALLSTTRDLLRVRDLLVAGGMAVAAPCLRQGPCPCLFPEAGEGATCHADMDWSPPPWYVRLAHRARIGKESLRFSFLVLAKPGSAVPAAGPDELRVVSERMLSKSGRLRYMVCNEDGRRSLSAKPAGGEPWAKTFMGLRRYDRIRVAGTEQRENGLGLTRESAIEVVRG